MFLIVDKNSLSQDKNMAIPERRKYYMSVTLADASISFPC